VTATGNGLCHNCCNVVNRLLSALLRGMIEKYWRVGRKIAMTAGKKGRDGWSWLLRLRLRSDSRVRVVWDRSSSYRNVGVGACIVGCTNRGWEDTGWGRSGKQAATAAALIMIASNGTPQL